MYLIIYSNVQNGVKDIWDNEIEERALNCHVFGWIDTNFEEKDVILDKVTLLEHFVRDETRESKSKCVGLSRWPLKVLPRRIGNKTLDNITSLFLKKGEMKISHRVKVSFSMIQKKRENNCFIVFSSE